MRIFIKCRECGNVVFTDRIHLLSVLASDDHRLVCRSCDGSLQQTNVFLCGVDRCDSCDTCDYRFYCFSQLTLPFEEVDVGNK